MFRGALKHKAVFGLLAAFLIAPMFALSLAPKTLASEPAASVRINWINYSTFTLRHDFGDVNPDDSNFIGLSEQGGNSAITFKISSREPHAEKIFFTPDGDDESSCTPLAVVRHESNTQVFHNSVIPEIYFKTHDKRGGGVTCKPYLVKNVNSTDIENRKIMFNWVDSGQIEPVGRLPFLQNPTGSGLRTRLFGVFQKSGNSRTFVEKPSSADCASELHVSADNKTTEFQVSTDKNSEGDCSNDYWTYKGISVGKVKENAGKPAGTGKVDEDTSISASGASDPAADPCGGNLGALAWMLCPVFRAIEEATKWAFKSVIEPHLEVQPLTPGTQAHDTLYKVWDAFRTLANIFFVLIFLIIIFANTLSIGLSAYAIKKMLPRLVFAAIFVQFSFFITQFSIDIGNILGAGIPHLIPKGVTGGGGTSGVHAALSTLGAGGTLVLAGGILTALEAWALLLPMALGLVLSLLSVVLTLVFRQVLINVLIVLAPLACVAWILPNTEKLFKLWWTNLIKVILMYPMIILLITMAAVTKQIATAGSGGIQEILALLIPTIAFFMIPATYKYSGDFMGKVAGAVKNRTDGYKKRLDNSEWKKNLQRDRELKLASRESNREVPGFGLKKAGGYIAGAAQGRIFGARSAGDKFRYMRAQTGAAEEMRKRVEAGNFDFSDLKAFADGDTDKVKSTSLRKMHGDTLATAAVHSMIGESGIYSVKMASQIEDGAFNSSQKDFLHTYVRSGKSGQKIRETNLVLGMANRQAFSHGRFIPDNLTDDALGAIDSQTKSMNTETLSKQRPEAMQLQRDLGGYVTYAKNGAPVEHGAKLISSQAIKGLAGPQVANRMSDEQRLAVRDAVVAAGTPANSAEAQAIIDTNGQIIAGPPGGGTTPPPGGTPPPGTTPPPGGTPPPGPATPPSSGGAGAAPSGGGSGSGTTSSGPGSTSPSATTSPPSSSSMGASTPTPTSTPSSSYAGPASSTEGTTTPPAPSGNDNPPDDLPPAAPVGGSPTPPDNGGPGSASSSQPAPEPPDEPINSSAGDAAEPTNSNEPTGSFFAPSAKERKKAERERKKAEVRQRQEEKDAKKLADKIAKAQAKAARKRRGPVKTMFDTITGAGKTAADLSGSAATIAKNAASATSAAARAKADVDRILAETPPMEAQEPTIPSPPAPGPVVHRPEIINPTPKMGDTVYFGRPPAPEQPQPSQPPDDDAFMRPM